MEGDWSGEPALLTTTNEPYIEEQGRESHHRGAQSAVQEEKGCKWVQKTMEAPEKSTSYIISLQVRTGMRSAESHAKCVCLIRVKLMIMRKENKITVSH